jgi:hypothetical protein
MNTAGNIPVLSISAVTGQGIDEWLNRIMALRVAHIGDLDLDYETYGQAEAFLGWLNATVNLTSCKGFSPQEFGEDLIAVMRQKCEHGCQGIAHLKVLLATTDASDRIGLTSNAGIPTWSHGGNLLASREASMIVNARVGVGPQLLREIVQGALLATASKLSVSVRIEDMDSFSPSPPVRQ